MTNIQSYIPIHPGAVVKDEVEARGICQKRLAELMGVPYTMLNEILNGKRNISTDMALLFEAALEINAEMLINMQTSYSLRIARSNATLKERFRKIRQACAAAF
jgi:addiction module HigA family antidote